MQEKSCRICLSSDAGRLEKLFDENSDVSRAGKIQFCSGIEVIKGRSLNFPHLTANSIQRSRKMIIFLR
jgi:hypothetical protein